MLLHHACKRRRPMLRAVAALLTVIPITALAASRDSDRRWMDKLRDGPGVVNHPVRIVPSSAVRIPKDWPLDGNGAIT